MRNGAFFYGVGNFAAVYFETFLCTIQTNISWVILRMNASERA